LEKLDHGQRGREGNFGGGCLGHPGAVYRLSSTHGLSMLHGRTDGWSNSQPSAGIKRVPRVPPGRSQKACRKNPTLAQREKKTNITQGGAGSNRFTTLARQVPRSGSDRAGSAVGGVPRKGGSAKPHFFGPPLCFQREGGGAILRKSLGHPQSRKTGKIFFREPQQEVPEVPPGKKRPECLLTAQAPKGPRTKSSCGKKRPSVMTGPPTVTDPTVGRGPCRKISSWYTLKYAA